MKLSIVHQINGNFYIEDCEDEAPMIRVEFCNEFVNLSSETKQKLANGLMETLIKCSNRQNENQK